jgi:hypothetical protein
MRKKLSLFIFSLLFLTGIIVLDRQQNLVHYYVKGELKNVINPESLVAGLDSKYKIQEIQKASDVENEQNEQDKPKKKRKIN